MAQLQVLWQIGPFDVQWIDSISIILPDCDLLEFCKVGEGNCVPPCVHVWTKLNHDVRLLIKGY